MSIRVCLTLAHEIPAWPEDRRARAVLIGDARVTEGKDWARVVTFADDVQGHVVERRHPNDCPCCLYSGSAVNTVYQETMRILRGEATRDVEIVYLGEPFNQRALRQGVKNHLMLQARICIEDYIKE